MLKILKIIWPILVLTSLLSCENNKLHNDIPKELLIEENDSLLYPLYYSIDSTKNNTIEFIRSSEESGYIALKSTKDLILNKDGSPKTKLNLKLKNDTLQIRKSGSDTFSLVRLEHGAIYQIYHYEKTKELFFAKRKSLEGELENKYGSKYELSSETLNSDNYFIQVYKEIVKGKELLLLTAGIGADEPRNGRAHYYSNIQSLTAPGVKYFLTLKDQKLIIYEVIFPL